MMLSLLTFALKSLERSDPKSIRWSKLERA
jgi:hypothetical protein